MDRGDIATATILFFRNLAFCISGGLVRCCQSFFTGSFTFRSLPRVPGRYFLSYQLVEDRGERHREHHADQPSETAADSDRREYPNGGQTYRRPDHARVDQVAFNLLKNHQIDHEPDSLHRTDHRDHERPDTRADERPHDRDQRRHADQRADHRRIRHTEYQHAYSAKGTEYQRFRTLTDHELCERLIRSGGDMHEPPFRPPRSERLDQPGELLRQTLLGRQNVQREHQRHEERNDSTDPLGNDRHRVADQFRRPAL